MTGTLRICRGLPGSGKSSFAKAWVKDDHTNRSRVSRDDIRTMLYGYPGTPIDFSREEEVTAIEEAAVRAGLKAGKDVLVDATHLRAKYIRKWNDLHPLTEVIDFEVSVDSAVLRDAHRQYPVGEVVIREMAQKFLQKGKLPPLPDLSAPRSREVRQVDPHDYGRSNAILVDIDGTLAHMTDRGPYDTSRYHTDKIDPNVRDIVASLEDDYYVIVATGRSEDFRDATTKWLLDNFVNYDKLIMRPSGDTRKDWVVKEELYWKHVAPDYNVIMAFDDRNQVVDHYRAMGITVAQVAPGDF